LSSYHDFPKGILVAVVVLLIVLNVPLLVLNLNLATFHILIVSKGMTTLEYLRACNAWEKNRRLQDQESFEKMMRAPGAFKPFPHCVDWVIFRRRGPKVPKVPKSTSSSKISKSKVSPACEAPPLNAAAQEVTSPAIVTPRRSSNGETGQETLPEIPMTPEVQQSAVESPGLANSSAVDEEGQNALIQGEATDDPVLESKISEPHQCGSFSSVEVVDSTSR